eukprot:m.31653 g.31653  ORF g.31653 m.31653 type:complete len:269 (+) comp31523_c1_seq5:364-1170(+)
MKHLFWLLCLLGFVSSCWSCPAGCTCRLGAVTCTGRSLNTIPTKDIPADTVQLSLNENLLTSLQPADFQNLSKIEFLYLGDNQISFIDEKTFSDLKNLKELRLNENELTKLPKEVFKDLSLLERISLSQNKFVGLPDGIFNGLNNLTAVDLKNNPLSCDCVTRWMAAWITTNSVIVTEPENVICDYPPSLKGKEIRNLTADQMICSQSLCLVLIVTHTLLTFFHFQLPQTLLHHQQKPLCERQFRSLFPVQPLDVLLPFSFGIETIRL